MTKSVGNIDSDECSFINDLQVIVSAARDISYRMANLMQVTQNWLIGWRIVEQEQQGKDHISQNHKLNKSWLY